MIATHLATTAWAWFRPNSLWLLAVVFLYGLYFVTGTDVNRPTVNSHLVWLLATATPAFWIGQCVREAQAWPSSALVPGYNHQLMVIGVGSTAFSLLLGFSAAWMGNLGLASPLALGTLATTASLLAGFHFRHAAFATFASVMSVLLIGALAVKKMPMPTVVSHPITSATALAASAMLLIHFRRRVQSLVADPSRRCCGTEKVRSRALVDKLTSQLTFFVRRRESWRVVLLFSAGAVLAVAFSSYHVDLNEIAWIYVAGLLVWATASGQSASFPHGQLAEATALLLRGAAKTRTAIGRQIMWRTLTDSVLGGIVFIAVMWMLTNEARLIEMSIALAAGHLYMAIASGSAWLLSSRSSVLVAMPFVVLVTWLGLQLLSMAWPVAVVAFVASAAIAIYWGGKRIGQLDFVS